MLVDEFDECSHNYAALDDAGLIVGSIRVVPDSPLGLPLERCAPLNGYRAGKSLVELCRLLTDPAHRASRIAGTLMKAGYQRALLHGATHAMLDTYVGDDAAHALYKKMGFERVGGEHFDPSWHCDLPVVAMAQDIARGEREWPVERPGLYRFFTAPDALIDHGESPARHLGLLDFFTSPDISIDRG